MFPITAKVQRVFASCRTDEHRGVADRFAKQAIKLHYKSAKACGVSGFAISLIYHSEIDFIRLLQTQSLSAIKKFEIM